MKNTWGSECPSPAAGSKIGREIVISEPKVLETASNHIYFYSEIDRESVMRLNKTMKDLHDDAIVRQRTHDLKDPEPMFLHIQSYGGGVFSGLAAADQLRRLKQNVPIITVVDGCCASAATFISVMGTRRLINENAFMLIHQLSAVAWGKFQELKDEMKNNELLMERIRKIYGQYTKVPVEKLDEILNHDLWFDAKTCLEFGMVDEIV